MQFFAAAVSQNVTDRLREIPTEFWVKLGLGILAIIVAVVVLRKIAKINKVVLGMIVVLALSFIGFNWIYERNEPGWATPVVNWLAEYFPTKGKIAAPGGR